MKDDVYEYLKEYGFSRDYLKNVEFENEAIYFLSLSKVKENIDFFSNKGLNKDEIINLFLNNSFNLTLSTKRKNEFDAIYINKLNCSNDEIKRLLELNNDIYSCSPVELNKIIMYLINEKKYSLEFVKKIILLNPKIINKKFDDIKEILSEV